MPWIGVRLLGTWTSSSESPSPQWATNLLPSLATSLDGSSSEIQFTSPSSTRSSLRPPDDNSTLFDLVDTSGEVNDVYTDVLYGVLVCLAKRGSSARRWLDTSGATAPRDGKRALLEVTKKRLLPREEEPLGHVSDLVDIKFPVDVDPEPSILDYYTAPAKRPRYLLLRGPHYLRERQSDSCWPPWTRYYTRTSARRWSRMLGIAQ
ncbi:hypothetical protein CYMTET_3307 [Cymbomonas tetramitiformis]|uniref:Uncharacterized protein n=1 Tax=Cymbomonas tetramitiformis TaxID=36881 RepID=A0AAE0H3R3_9CHLO|nr:hypothetical protein CYMTET_3307 [Cymbomonas tetramitiformis]